MTDRSKGIRCPRCTEPARKAASKAYCGRCGWNRDKAEVLLRKSSDLWGDLKFFFVAAIFLFLFILVTWTAPWSQRLKAVGFLLTFVFVSIVVNHLFNWRALRQLLDSRATPNDVPVLAPNKAPALPEKYRYLLSLSRPRKIGPRERWQYFLAALLLIPFILIASGMLWFPGTRGVAFIILAAMVVISVGGAALLRQDKTIRRLLTQGELAVGLITEQRILRYRRHRSSEIHYEFTDSNGRKVIGSDTDPTWTFFEEMAIPIFYDQQDPDQHVPMCKVSHNIYPISGSS